MFIKPLKNQRKPLIFDAPKANWELRFASKRLLATDFEALEVSGTRRGDQEGVKEVSKSSKVTIHGVCRVIMSRHGAACLISFCWRGLCFAGWGAFGMNARRQGRREGRSTYGLALRKPRGPESANSLCHSVSEAARPRICKQLLQFTF